MALDDRSPVDEECGLGYQKTLMYGRYTKDLSSYAKSEARRLDRVRRESLAEVGLGKKQKKTVCGNSRFAVWLAWLWKHSFARLGEDWVFLALLGVIMAVLSFIMDRGISMCNHARIWLYEDFEKNDVVAAYFAWVTLPVVLVLFSAGFVQIVAPQSIGSGIPEMKTILRGVALKEYLTFRTLVAKSVGLTTTLGSGMPLGKEGPFVHIASIAATLLSKLVTSFQNIYENESRNCEMLAAACAVGVASCFAAPIGGVLFSIEVTTVYFAVRNYWRAFFAAVCGATVFRLLAVWFNEATTVTAVFRTDFAMENPFDPQELFIFALMGVLCGLGGAFYVWAHRQYVLFMRSSKTLNNFLQKNRFLYPGIVALLVSSVSFHNGLGQYIAGKLTSHDQLHHLFSNFTWTKENITARESETLDNWTTEDTNVFVTLFGFTLYTFVFSIICSTLPVPSGSFIPVFKIGAAVGRAIGEAVHLALPTIVFANQRLAPIIPGGYATVGAAAFSGAVTHTISVSVIVFEITGQITHIIPMMLSVLISNAVASFLQPSIYDSIILIKKLPYLPDLLPSSSGIYNIYVENFMVKDVKYIWKGMTYKDLKNILKETKKLRSFPLVDSPDSMILLGSVQRLQLIGLIEKQIGRDRRLEVAAKLQQERIIKERERKQLEQKQRRPSRFEVTPAPDILKLQPNYHHPVFGGQPKKSILKKTNSFTLKGFSPLAQTSPNSTPYTTVTGAESRIRLAFEAIFKKSSTLQDVEPTLGESQNLTATLTDSGVKPQILRNSTSPSGTMQSGQLTSTANKKVTLPRERVCDMSPEEQVMWQDAELAKSVEFTCNVDPAPFQLVERTSLLKVHSLFSMVGVNHAYVTACGKLVGVVALKELRKAIEDANSGNLPVHKDNDNYELNCTSPLMTTSDKNQSTITSMDSAVSTNTVNSDNQSMDIEMDIRSPPPLPPKPTKV